MTFAHISGWPDPTAYEDRFQNSGEIDVFKSVLSGSLW